MLNEKGHITTSNSAPETEHYRFTANGNLQAYMYENLLYVHYGYDGGTTRTYKYSMDLSPNWVNGRLENVNFNLRNAMFYPNSYLNFNQDGHYTKHYYNGMERIASRLGDRNISINVNDPELQDRKDQLDTNIRRNIVEITGYEFLPVGEEQNHEDPKPVFELPQVGMNGLHPIGSGDVYYYHPNHLGSTCYVTDGNASVQQGFLYAPFGEITNEYNNSFGSSIIPKYSFNAKELDEETGFYYYEARYYAPPVFVSRDRLFEKYPTISPYTYCANNPVKYVDPTGEEFGDYYDLKGNYLGWDGHWDDNVYIVENDFIEKNSNGTINTDKITPLLKTTYKTLETICTVFYKAWNNGGKNEEPAVVANGLITIYGKTGGVGSDGKDECYLPPVPEPLKGFRITSIHSHPFKLSSDNVFEKPSFHVVDPSDDDINTFRNQDINIIIGYVVKPKKTSEAYPNSSEKIGAVFYNANSVEIMRMSMHSIFKIIGNRARAKQNIFNMFIKNHLKQ